MPLSLHGWPPLASHVIALLLGMALTQVEHSTSAPEGNSAARTRWARGKAYICLPASVVAAPYRGHLKPQQALGLAQIATASQEARCLIQTEPLQLVQEKPHFVLKASTQTLAAIGQNLILQGRKNPRVKVFPMHALSHLAFCAQTPQVVYGAF